MAKDPVRTNALTHRDLRLLRRAGLLDMDGFMRGLAAIRDEAFWGRWAGRLLLTLAVAHLLSGILFFFAYNWADLPAMGKFAVIQGGILLCILGALWRGLDDAAGQALLIGANVLVLILFATIGMVFQTGADAWQLFAAWTGMTVIWTLASRNVAAWLLWLTALTVTLGLFTDQVLKLKNIYGFDGDVVVLPAIAVLAGLVAWERGYGHPLSWLSAVWPRIVLLLALLALLYVIAMDYLFDSGRDIPAPEDWAGSLPLLLALGGLGWVYRRRVPDFGAVAACMGALALWLLAVGFRLGIEHYDSVLSWFTMTGWSVFVLWLATRQLMRLHREMGGPHEP